MVQANCTLNVRFTSLTISFRRPCLVPLEDLKSNWLCEFSPTMAQLCGTVVLLGLAVGMAWGHVPATAPFAGPDFALAPCNASWLRYSAADVLTSRFDPDTKTTAPSSVLPPTHWRAIDSLMASMANAVRVAAVALHYTLAGNMLLVYVCPRGLRPPLVAHHACLPHAGRPPKQETLWVWGVAVVGTSPAGVRVTPALPPFPIPAPTIPSPRSSMRTNPDQRMSCGTWTMPGWSGVWGMWTRHCLGLVVCVAHHHSPDSAID
jgi:hypothetical protein